jgi:GNAT superfamily N-acetyltransferase
MEQAHGQYLVSDDPARLDATAIHAYLSSSYWCENIPREVVDRALANSLCVGAYLVSGASSVAPGARKDKQVGLARIVTDYATFAYLCDVYVLEEHRKHGLAKALMAMLVAHPRLQGLRRWNLVTRDAHKLYTQFGFTAIAHPDRYMERLFRDVYRPAGEKR